MTRPAPLLASFTLFASFALSGCIVIPVPEATAAKLPLAVRIGGGDRSEAAPTPRALPASARCTPSPEREAYGAKVIAGTNALRAAQGLPALRRSALLDAAAQAQACDNAARNALTHRGSDGSNVFTRVRGAGYPAARATENAGQGFTGGPEQMLAFWNASPGHRANLLDPAVTEIGFGLAQGAKPAWILVAARPR